MRRKSALPVGVCVCVAEEGKTAVLVCMSVGVRVFGVGGPVSSNGQETLNAGGYKKKCSHTRGSVHATHNPVVCLGKLRQAACSVTTRVSGWSADATFHSN